MGRRALASVAAGSLAAGVCSLACCCAFGDGLSAEERATTAALERTRSKVGCNPKGKLHVSVDEERTGGRLKTEDIVTLRPMADADVCCRGCRLMARA